MYATANGLYVTDQGGVRTSYGDRAKLPYLGGGASRTVYGLGDGTVIKVAKRIPPHGMGFYDNQAEWELWNLVKGTRDSRHFAECYAISETGSWVIQRQAERTLGDGSPAYEEWWKEEGLRISDEYGLYDVHGENVATLANGNVVIIDYAA